MNETIIKLYDLKSKVLNGEEVSPKEYRKVIEGLRHDRTSKAAEKNKKITKKKKASTLPLDLNDLFNQPVKED